LLYAFTWAAVGTLLLSAAAFKRPHYVLSVLPAYCLLLAPVIDRLFLGRLAASPAAIRRTCGLVPIGLAIAAVVGGVVVRKELPSLLGVYVLIAALVTAIWTMACISFARERRLTAFAQLQLGTLVVLLLGWPAAGSHLKLDPEAHAMAAQLHEHGLRPIDEIYLVGGRPNSAIEFYSGLRIRRLINELEMADLRQNRRAVDDQVRIEAQHRIERLLGRTDAPVYLILESGHYELFRRYSRLHARVFFELKGYAREPGEEFIVITQTWNTGPK
jgi:4-amino-4-deoxy-L-arabinose transferase-like glycosyltransferase